MIENIFQEARLRPKHAELPAGDVVMVSGSSGIGPNHQYALLARHQQGHQGHGSVDIPGRPKLDESSIETGAGIGDPGRALSAEQGNLVQELLLARWEIPQQSSTTD